MASGGENEGIGPEMEITAGEEAQGGSRWLSRLLPAAVRFWLQSQAEHIENLSFDLAGRDRDLLGGHIPGISLQADRAIYRGIHLSHIALEAQEIHINLRQILRGKALRLQAPFPVTGQLVLTEADLNASLTSEILGEGLYDLLGQWVATEEGGSPDWQPLRAVLAACPDKTVQPHYAPQAAIAPDKLTLHLEPRSGQAVPPLTVETTLGITAGRYLTLHQPRLVSDLPGNETPEPLPDFCLDLGPETTLTDCTLGQGRLTLAGSVRVLP